MLQLLLALIVLAVMPLRQMPTKTDRWHAPKAKGEWWGDRLSALALAVRQGFRFIDQNFQWAWRDPSDHSKGGTAFGMHWGIPEMDNYRWILDRATGRVRRMTYAELRRHISQWPAADVFMWRRGPQKSSERPHTLAAHARVATAVGIQLVPELKSRAFAKKAVAAQVVATMVRYGQEPWFMALFTMWGCWLKCRAVIAAGGQFAVIFGGRRALMRAKRAAIAAWPTPPTRVWG